MKNLAAFPSYAYIQKSVQPVEDFSKWNATFKFAKERYCVGFFFQCKKSGIINTRSKVYNKQQKASWELTNIYFGKSRGKSSQIMAFAYQSTYYLFYVDKASSDKLKMDSWQSHWFICAVSHSTLAQVAPFLLFKMAATLSPHTTAHKKRTTQRHVTRGVGTWNTGAATAKSPAVNRQKN